MAADGTVKIGTELDESGAKSGLNKIGSAVKAATAAVVATVSASAVKIGQYAVSVGSPFEAGMSEVSAISSATGSDLEALTEKAKEMGATTKFSASESAEALKYMAMAGWKTEDMLDGIEGIMNLAAASGENLATTSDIVTDALTAFGLSASDSGHFADVLAAASSNANTNVSMLGESFKYVAPVAGALNYSVEDISVALGLMANSGIKANQAGTALRMGISSMVNPTDKAAIAMKKYGLSMTNADGTMKSYGEVMDMLRENLGGLDEATQTATVSTIVGKEAMSGMLAIINASESDYDKLTDAIRDADGAAKDMADTMQDNLAGKYVIMQSAMEGFGISVYEHLESPFSSAVETATEAIDRMSERVSGGDLSGAVEKVGAVVGNVAVDLIGFAEDAVAGVIQASEWVIDNSELVESVIAGVGAAWIGYKVATEGAAVSQAALNAVMNLNPVALLVGGLAALTVGITAYSLAVTTSYEEQSEVFRESETAIANAQAAVALLNDSNSSVEKSFKKIDEETGKAKKLTDQIYTLAQKTKLSNEEQTQMASLIDELNQTIPGMNLSIDEQTGALSRTREETYALISSYEAMAKAAAAQEYMTEVAKSQLDAQMALTDLEETRKGLLDEHTALVNKLADAEKTEYDMRMSGADTSAYVAAIDEATIAIQSNEQALKDNEEQQKLTNDAISASEEKMSTLEGYVTEYKENTQAVTAATTSATEAMDNLSAGANELATELITYGDISVQVSEETAEAWDTLCDAWTDAYDSAKSSIEGQLGLFDAYKAGTAVSAADTLVNLQSQIDAMRNWSTNMDELAKAGVSDGILKELAKLGPEGYAQVQVFANEVLGGNTQFIEDLNRIWAEDTSLKETMAQKTADLQVNLEEGFTTLTGTAESGAENMAAGYENTLTQHLTTMKRPWETICVDAEELLQGIDTSGCAETAVENYTVGIRCGGPAIKQSVDETTAIVEEGLGSVDAAGIAADSIDAYSSAVSGKAGEAQRSGEEVSEATDTGLGSADMIGTATSLLTGLLGIFTGGTFLAGLAGAAVSTALDAGLGAADTDKTAVDLANAYTSTIYSRVGSATSSGYALSAGVAAGIAAGIPAVAAAASRSASAAISAFRATAQIHSPSKIAVEDGSFWSEGIEIGILQNEDKIGSAASDTADRASREFYQNAKERTYFDAGAIVAQMQGQTIDLSWRLMGGMEQAAAKERDAIVLQTQGEHGESLDYERLGEEVAKAFSEVQLNIDGYKAGQILTPYTNENMEEILSLEERGVI